MDIFGQIQSIKYKHTFAPKNFTEYNLLNLREALDKNTNFLLNIDNINKFAVSWWVSAKRTRSYPYARVYNTLAYAGKRVTIIPVYKDEGKDGDRDFLQWDTISLMNLLGVNVIIAYYETASKNIKFKNKITNQRFNTDYISFEIKRLISYQSDPLHWNLEQIDNIINLNQKAVEAYKKISKETGVIMHSEEKLHEKISFLKKNKEYFMLNSRKLASEAQKREKITTQPKENINSGEKAIVTISNYLGGHYYFTADEARIENDILYIVEAKHSSSLSIPSGADIKEGLFKMILFSNLKKAEVQGKEYKVIPVLKLTGVNKTLTENQINILAAIKEEADINGFYICFRGEIL